MTRSTWPGDQAGRKPGSGKGTSSMRTTIFVILTAASYPEELDAPAEIDRCLGARASRPRGSPGRAVARRPRPQTSPPVAGRPLFPIGDHNFHRVVGHGMAEGRLGLLDRVAMGDKLFQWVVLAVAAQEL